MACLYREIGSVVIQCTFYQLQFYGSYTYLKLFCQANLSRHTSKPVMANSQQCFRFLTFSLFPLLPTCSAHVTHPYLVRYRHWRRGIADLSKEFAISNSNLSGFPKTDTAWTTIICKDPRDTLGSNRMNLYNHLKGKHLQEYAKYVLLLHFSLL